MRRFQHSAMQAAFLWGTPREAVQVCVDGLFGDGRTNFAAEYKNFMTAPYTGGGGLFLLTRTKPANLTHKEISLVFSHIIIWWIIIKRKREPTSTTRTFMSESESHCREWWRSEYHNTRGLSRLRKFSTAWIQKTTYKTDIYIYKQQLNKSSLIVMFMHVKLWKRQISPLLVVQDWPR